MGGRALIAIVFSIAMPCSLLKAGDKLNSIPLKLSDFHHLDFDSIPATKYHNEGETLVADVNKSSSFLVKSFALPLKLKKVTAISRTIGSLRIRDLSHEETKEGDDAVLRIGLVIEGDRADVPFFAPSWAKKLKDVLQNPVGKMIYTVVNSHHPAGARWLSPHSDKIELIAASERVGDSGWRTSTHTFTEALSIIGLWIMADGDDTGSNFTTELRSLLLD